jgi:hypothetical protein
MPGSDRLLGNPRTRAGPEWVGRLQTRSEVKPPTTHLSEALDNLPGIGLGLFTGGIRQVLDPLRQFDLRLGVIPVLLCCARQELPSHAFKLLFHLPVTREVEIPKGVTKRISLLSVRWWTPCVLPPLSACSSYST